jgi:hypothetical protein
MNAFKLTKCVCISALTLFIGIAAHAEEEHGLLATQVQLDASEISPNSAQTVIAAFMPTGSDSEVCFVNLGDSGFYLGYFSPTICIRRTVNGVKGLVVILGTNGWALPPEFVMRVSVYQNGAKYYGPPTLWLGD